MFLKPVIATAGDLVVASAAGVAVNGRLIQDSAPVGNDSSTEIPFGAYRLARGELWLLSTRHPRSFDSRYFGAIKRTTVRAKARPLLVWE
jgi:type IV secretory pathway protease TraF